MTKSMINDLTVGSVPKKLIRFALPFAASNLLQALYNIVDMMVIGQFVGSTGLSAVSVGSDILTMLTMLCMGFSSAGQIMIAQYVGAGRRQEISYTIGTMFSMITIIALCFCAIGIGFSDPILRLLNTPAEAFQEARAYSITCYCGLVFIYGYNTVSAILRGMGDSKRPFVFISIAALTNVVLDLLFVVGFHLGAMGAALATVIAQGVSFGSSLVYLFHRRDSFGFDFKTGSFKIRRDQAAAMLKLGGPLALQHGAIMFSVIFVNAKVNAYGLIISAVNGVGNKFRSFVAIVTNSISAASSSMVGQNLGAKKHDRVKKVVHTGLAVNLIYTTILCIIMAVFPEKVFGLFTKDPEVLAWAPVYAGVTIVSFYASAMMGPFNCIITGLGYATLSLIIGLMDGVVARISLSLIFGSLFGIEGFWYGNAAAGFVTVIMAAIYYYSGRWKTRKLLVK